MMYYYGNSWGMPHSSLWGMGFGFINLVFWIFVIFIFIRLIRNADIGHVGKGGGHSKDAMEILKERYAKGEIDKEKFESMKKDLE